MFRNGHTFKILGDVIPRVLIQVMNDIVPAICFSAEVLTRALQYKYVLGYGSRLAD